MGIYRRFMLALLAPPSFVVILMVYFSHLSDFANPLDPKRQYPRSSPVDDALSFLSTHPRLYFYVSIEKRMGVKVDLLRPERW